MAQRIEAEMNTKVALDLIGATQSVKGLTTAVRSSQAAWRSQESLLKSSGDLLKAAQTRYDGLGKSIENQQKKIALLKQRQSELQGNTKETAAAYVKYQQDIDKAQTQLASMTEQQERAKSAMTYQTSGLAKLQAGYRQMNQVSQSYVNRLEAEGKSVDANKARMSGYKSTISNLSDQLKLQESELARVAAESGKTSNAYAKQQTRVNETATSLAKTRTNMNNLNNEMKQANPSIFSRMKSAIAGMNNETKKTPGLLKKIVAGGLITNAVSNGFSALTSGIKNTIKSGLELNEAGETLKNTWVAMGKSGNDIQILSDQMSYLRAKTGASAGEVNNLQRTIDTLTHGNTEKTMMVSQGLSAIGVASHLSGEQTDGLGKSLSRVIASGDLTTSSLARLEKAAPTMGAQLAKAAGVSQSAFATMVDKGKISSDKFLNLISQVGINGKDVFDRFGKTGEGAMAQINGGWLSLKAKMAAPLLDVKNSGMSSIVNILTSKVVQDAATTLGKGIANLAAKGEQLLNYVAAHKKDVTGIATDLWSIAKIAGAEAWSIFKDILKDVADHLHVGGKAAKDMSDPLGTIHAILDKIVKNKDGIKTTVKVVLSLLAAKKALEFAGALGKVYSGLKSLGSTSLAKGISSTMGSITSGSKLGGFGQSLKSAGGVKGLSTAGKVGTGLSVAGIGIDAGMDIVKAFTSKSMSTKFQAAGSGIGKLVGGGIGLFFGGPLGAAIGTKIGGFIGKWGGVGAKGFTDGWNKAGRGKKPEGWLEGLGWNARQMTNKVSKWWDGLQKTNKKQQAAMQKQQQKDNKQAQKNWNDFWSGVSKGWTGFWTKVQKNSAKSAAAERKQQLADHKQAQKDWKNFESSVSNGWNGFWSGVHSKASAGMNKLSSKVNSGVSSIRRGWNSAWNGMAKFFGGIWSGMKSAAKSGLNGVIGIVNGAISGINWVWQKFTGHNAIKKIQKLATGGVVGKMHVVMVNDGAGDNYKELYQLPTGHFGMLQQRNAVTMLPEGTRVFNGNQTRNIMNMAGIAHYAKGGVIGAVGSLFSKGWDKLTAIGDWLKHPIANMSKVIYDRVSGMSSTTSMYTNLGQGVVSKIISGVSSWAEKQLKKLESSLTPKNPTGSGVNRWKPYVKKALEANGLSTSAGMVAKVLRQISTESGGNPNATQHGYTDVNTLSGDLAKGLMQTISATFNAYAFKGHHNIYNGYDNLLAALAYAKNRYGSSLSGLGEGHGYANGGLVNGAAYRLTGEAGPEMILPLSQSKSSRAWQLLGNAVARINQNQSQANVSVSDNNLSDVTECLDKMIELIGTLVGNTTAILQVVGAGGNGDDVRQLLRKIMPSISAQLVTRQGLAQRGGRC